MTDFTVCTAAQLTDLYRTGSTNPVTVAQQVLAKIERLNPILNAFCFTDPATTMAQAQASEQRWKNGQPLSDLDGVPIAVKDSILTQGWPTLHASRAVDPNQPWTEDAPSVARLREAGAVFVGKTTMPEFSWGTKTTMSQIYGVTTNPWNIKCSPGGSSGGSAVAVASNVVPLAIGTDLGGSITVPASFCGVFGYKPSAGKVAHSPQDALNLSTIGIFARSVNDFISTINIVSHPDIKDCDFMPNIEIKADTDFDIKSLHTGLATGLQDITLQLVFDKIKDLWPTNPIDPLQPFDLHLALKIFSNVTTPVRLHQWQNLSREQQSVTEKHTQKTAMMAHIKSNLYEWLVVRAKFTSTINQCMSDVGVIVVPATSTSAADIPCDTVLNNNDINLSPWSILCVVAGLPSVTVPVGIDSQGLPLSVIVIGPQHRDARILQVARAIEKQFPMPACPAIFDQPIMT